MSPPVMTAGDVGGAIRCQTATDQRQVGVGFNTRAGDRSMVQSTAGCLPQAGGLHSQVAGSGR